MKKESAFEKQLEVYAPIYKCLYMKIPDIIPLKRYGKITAHRRPFDAILLTPTANYLIECKVDNNTLKPHQQATQERINAINGSYYVLRKKFLKKGIVYRIEQQNTVLLATDKIDDIFKYFKTKGE